MKSTKKYLCLLPIALICAILVVALAYGLGVGEYVLPTLTAISMAVYVPVIVSNSIAIKHFPESYVLKAVILAEGIVALVLHALLSDTLGSELAKNYSVDDGIFFGIWIKTAILLALVSFFLGRVMLKKLLTVKLVSWFVCISAAAFVNHWLDGSPKTPHTSHPTSLVIWILESMTIFAFCLVGVAVTVFAERKGSDVVKYSGSIQSDPQQASI